jgi:uncharacterized protein YukE
MNEIKVNTDDLRNNASNLNAKAENLNTTLGDLFSVVNSIDSGKYQSQLSNQVRLRLNSIQGGILNYRQRLEELADKLNKIANDFEQANSAGMIDVTRLSNQMFDFTNSSVEMITSATLCKMDTQKSNKIWSWFENINGNINNWILSSTKRLDKFEDYETEMIIRGLLDLDNETQFIEQIKNANLRIKFRSKFVSYVFDNEEFILGKDDGNTYEVAFLKKDINSLAFVDYDKNIIAINYKLEDQNKLLVNIAHEIQHAIDFETEIVDLEKIRKPEKMILEDLNNTTKAQLDEYDWKSLEEALAAFIVEAVKSEIRAHARGYQFSNDDNLPGKGVLDLDEEYKTEEKRIILNERKYLEEYRKIITEWFSKADIDVQVIIEFDDNNGEINVSLSNPERKSIF